MPSVNSVLIFDTKNEETYLRTEDIKSDEIPETLNGESGFHAYHVRLLTELILREIANVTDKYPLSEDDIRNMSIASTLHDIGKSKIPQSILNYPGRLSSVEYDIVKKHTVLGCEMIEESTCAHVDPEIIRHAKDIAKYHHERIDGTGYPEGLRGDEIPLSARVVSIADSYDALTSNRSYKDAFSQDVAIEMISNGMSGVFDGFLVECLLNVVNNNDLLEIRDRIFGDNRVVVDPNTLAPKRILLVGNTGYITETFIEEAFENNNILIAGNTHLKSKGRIKVYSGTKIPYKRIFETYDFDVIIFFARELTYRSKQQPDTENLREILALTARYQQEAKVIYFSSLDGAYENKKDKSVFALSKENLCEFYTKHFGVDVKIVRIPHLYRGTLDGDFLNDVFTQMETGKVKLSEGPGHRAFFISMRDVSILVARFLENWQEGIGTLSVNDEFNITFGDIMERISMCKSGVDVSYSASEEGDRLETKNTALRNEYGWFSKMCILDEIADEYDSYLIDMNLKANDFWSKVKVWIRAHAPVVKALEIAVLFIITELLTLMTGSSVIFSIVDFRMAFIVIIAIIHGLNSGLVAAALSSVAWVISKVASGTGPLTIFYEPTNWFTFVYYFLVGALSGYVRLTKDDKIKFGEEQVSLLEEKLEFTRELYQDTFDEKRDLKKQIIGSKDSFGKIFEVTRSLDTVEVHKLYLKIMETFEETLENKSLSVYSVNDKSAFGRLEVSSRDIINEVSRSISLDTYKPVLDKVKKDEVWKNTEFIPGLPMYAVGIWRGEKLELLIFIWHIKPEQNSLYYINLFKILCDLAEISLLRAYDYNQNLYEKQYIEGTRILCKEEFARIHDNFRDMANKKIFSYEFMEMDVNGHSYEEVDDMIGGKIRANDILGQWEDGKLAVLLSQATKDDLKFILPRFENLDINVTIK